MYMHECLSVRQTFWRELAEIPEPSFSAAKKPGIAPAGSFCGEGSHASLSGGAEIGSGSAPLRLARDGRLCPRHKFGVKAGSMVTANIPADNAGSEVEEAH